MAGNPANQDFWFPREPVARHLQVYDCFQLNTIVQHVFCGKSTVSGLIAQRVSLFLAIMLEFTMFGESTYALN